MRLFHFSEEPHIAVFAPRPVAIPSQRPPGLDWLNGPLVWAIDEAHAFLYLLPRDCPRILIWATDRTTAEDRRDWLADATIVAFIETAWLDRLRGASICRYTLPSATFEDLNDAGMWVSRTEVRPLAVERLEDLPARLSEAGVDLRQMETLTPLRDIWSTSLHASGVRLRNALGWPAPGYCGRSA